MTLGFDTKCRDGRDVFTESKDVSPDIRLLQSALKDNPGNVRMKIELAELLDDTEDTNAAHLAWLDIEKICRQRLESNAGDGSLLFQLAEAVSHVGSDAETESALRRAVLVSSNDWTCWAALGSFLEANALELLVPEQLSGSVHPSYSKPPQELLDFHPQPEALQRSEALLRESGQCLDRITALAPNESDAWAVHGVVPYPRIGWLC